MNLFYKKDKSIDKKNKLSSVMRLIATKKFFYIIISITILQALWYSVSFLPSVNDEPKHFRTTEIYTEQLTPFFNEQPEEWDNAGQVARGGSYLFYYAMSWPLRILQIITDDTQL